MNLPSGGAEDADDDGVLGDTTWLEQEGLVSVSWQRRYLVALYWTFTTLTTVGCAAAALPHHTAALCGSGALSHLPCCSGTH